MFAFDIPNDKFFFSDHLLYNKMYSTITEQGNETAPLRSGARTSAYLPINTAGQTFGTNYFLM